MLYGVFAFVSVLTFSSGSCIECLSSEVDLFQAEFEGRVSECIESMITIEHNEPAGRPEMIVNAAYASARRANCASLGFSQTSFVRSSASEGSSELLTSQPSEVSDQAVKRSGEMLEELVMRARFLVDRHRFAQVSADVSRPSPGPTAEQLALESMARARSDKNWVHFGYSDGAYLERSSRIRFREDGSRSVWVRFNLVSTNGDNIGSQSFLYVVRCLSRSVATEQAIAHEGVFSQGGVVSKTLHAKDMTFVEAFPGSFFDEVARVACERR